MKEIYLIGTEHSCIQGCKLPTIRQVLSVFFHKHRTLNFTIKKSAAKVVDEVQPFWIAAGLSTCLARNAIVKSSFGIDVREVNLSHRSIHNQRKKIRADTASQLKQDLQVEEPLVIHWDGKFQDIWNSIDKIILRLEYPILTSLIFLKTKNNMNFNYFAIIFVNFVFFYTFQTQLPGEDYREPLQLAAVFLTDNKCGNLNATLKQATNLELKRIALKKN
ncbi:hypothetical protein ABEB36_013574 [Hypothenemus hampei]|uniref:Uncharacterized protein n=1 Tax=Hypothenemus hampei TaxID=57062 RepID=A0ABD1E4Y4_HYPHA